MIRSANHSSYPKIANNPLDQGLRVVLRRHARGAATAEELVNAQDEVTTVAVAEQSRAFLEIVTDGMVRWNGPLSHLATGLDGLVPRELMRWFDTNFYDRRIEVAGEIRRRGPFLVHDWEVAQGVAPKKLVKAVLPGPVTFARLARDRHYGSRDKLAGALASALAAEVADLAAAGARVFQLDEPLLCRHPEDLELVRLTGGEVFAAAGAGAVTIVSTYFGDLGPLAARWSELPGTHLGLDLTAGGTPLERLAELPPGRGVYLGLFDARRLSAEYVEDVAAELEPYRAVLQSRDVIVGPNAGLELLPRDQAFDKLLQARYLAEKLSQEWTWAS
ncbi:MAG TPA: hypothetical protein VJS92_12945 [Candidatus Polarisedimenticolaceae bacterium]|nr:hypothetical protein [Candidatus Polarisedimenticolaceae bacterium]